MPLEPNQRLGDFVIVREIGRGGMGAVYEAVQTSLNRRVALKVLPDEMAADPKAIRRFHREVEAVAKLNQPGIVPVYCFAEERGIHFYAMELVHGRPLSDLISETRHRVSSGAGATGFLSAYTTRREPSESDEFRGLPTLVPDAGQQAPPSATQADQKERVRAEAVAAAFGPDYVQDVCDIIAQVSEAIDHAHRRRVIHRDIKPQNLLINDRGEVKVTDFGLARYEGDLGLTEMGKAVGTPLYMSPEQVAGGNVGLDKRTDIYSLGASLYEMLTLRPPFTGETREALYKQIMFDEPIRPRRLNRAMPGDLETIVLKAIEKDPSLRYQSAQELADDLRRFLRDEPIWARPQGPVVRLTKWVKRNKALATVSAAAVLAVAVTCTAFVVHGRRSSRRAAGLLLNRARVARDRGSLSDALKLCSQALGSWPESWEAQREMGRIEEHLVRAEEERRVAAQQRQAQTKAEQGTDLFQKSMNLEDDIMVERVAVKTLKETIKGYDPLAKKKELWNREGEADRLVQQREQLVNEAVAHLLSALRLDAKNLLAKRMLADIYWARFVEATAARQRTQAKRCAELVRVHDEEGRYAARLKGDGTLAVCTSPLGASVMLYAYVEERPLLVTGHELALGGDARLRLPSAHGELPSHHQEGRLRGHAMPGLHRPARRGPGRHSSVHA